MNCATIPATGLDFKICLRTRKVTGPFEPQVPERPINTNEESKFVVFCILPSYVLPRVIFCVIITVSRSKG